MGFFKTMKLLAIVFLLAVAACTSVPLASESEDTEAKNFEVPAEKSRIYIFRNEILGGAHKVAVTLDSNAIGQTGPYTYFSLDVEPGRHLVSCLGKETRTVEIFTKKGQAIFVRLEMLLAGGTSTPHCTVYEVSDKEGRAAIKESKLGKIQSR